MPRTWSMGRFRGLDLTLVKPLTYMNDSGLAVRKVLAREHAPLDDLLVVADDFALPFGKLRFREGGGPGGHNGLRSIIEELGTEKFSRLRVGIGEPDRNAVDHVLSKFAPDEQQRLDELLDAAADAVEGWARDGTSKAANRFNTFELRPADADAARPARRGRRPARTPTASGGRRPAGGGSCAGTSPMPESHDARRSVARRGRDRRHRRARRRGLRGPACCADAAPTRSTSTSPMPRRSIEDHRDAVARETRGAGGRRPVRTTARRTDARTTDRHRLPDLSALPPLLAATGSFADLRERLGSAAEAAAAASGATSA